MNKPSVPRRHLFLIAGALWAAAGLILIERAYIWLSDFDTERLILVLALGILLALIIYFSGFIKVARKNVNRIYSMPENVCIFAFTAWKGYILIAIMVTAGIILRSSSFSKHYLALLYVAMGGSLIFGSILFMSKFFKYKSRRK